MIIEGGTSGKIVTFSYSKQSVDRIDHVTFTFALVLLTSFHVILEVVSLRIDNLTSNTVFRETVWGDVNFERYRTSLIQTYIKLVQFG